MVLDHCDDKVADTCSCVLKSVFPLPSSARGDRGKTRNIDKMLETMKR